MYIFLGNFKPLSVNVKNKKHKSNYKDNIQNSFKTNNSNVRLLEGSLYGIVYYFHNVKTDLDADNLSKPIWDALVNLAYPDDKKIKFRSVGIFDLRSETIEVLDISQIPDSILIDFLKMIDEDEKHILYVEVGKLDYSLLRFGFEKAR